jgi:hypothetical protein
VIVGGANHFDWQVSDGLHQVRREGLHGKANCATVGGGEGGDPNQEYLPAIGRGVQSLDKHPPDALCCLVFLPLPCSWSRVRGPSSCSGRFPRRSTCR